MHERGLQWRFAFIFASLLACTVWVGARQSLFDWGGLTTPPDDQWKIIAFYVCSPLAMPEPMTSLSMRLLGRDLVPGLRAWACGLR
jgi:hypothetical protein